MSTHTISYHDDPCHTILHHAAPHHTQSFHTYHTIQYRTIPSHITSPNAKKLFKTVRSRSTSNIFRRRRHQNEVRAMGLPTVLSPLARAAVFHVKFSKFQKHTNPIFRDRPKGWAGPRRRRAPLTPFNIKKLAVSPSYHLELRGAVRFSLWNP